jgi:hypothetical protein
MFAEVGAPHHRPHFHAAIKNSRLCSPSIPLNALAAIFRERNSVLPKPGLKSIMTNCSATSTRYSCNPVSHPSRLNHCGSRGDATVEHAIYRVERFEIVGPYTLALQFDDGTHQRIDFRPVLEGQVFAPLQDLKVFNSVELDATFGTIQWPNGADFDPETLHDWPKYRDELVTMARHWAATSKPERRTAG